jgi:hypothetical protein
MGLLHRLVALVLVLVLALVLVLGLEFVILQACQYLAYHSALQLPLLAFSKRRLPLPCGERQVEAKQAGVENAWDQAYLPFLCGRAGEVQLLCIPRMLEVESDPQQTCHFLFQCHAWQGPRALCRHPR